MNSGTLRQSRYSWLQQRAADVLLLLAFTLAVVPEPWLPEPIVSGAQHALWPYLLSTVFILSGYFSCRPGMHAMLVLLCFGALWMMAVGGLDQFDTGLTKSFGGDVAIFTAAIAGFMWAAQRDLSAIVFQVRAWVLITLVWSGIAIVGLHQGTLESLGAGNRLLVFSLFWAAWLLVSAVPFLFASAHVDGNAAHPQRRAQFWRIVALASWACVCVVAFMSATRSVFLWELASVVVLAITEANGRRLRLKIAIIIGLSAMAVAIGPGILDQVSSAELGTRFHEGALREDGRFMELQDMGDDLDEGLAMVHGKGFGSVFYSTGTGSGLGKGSYVLSPHIGILTTLYKGGICMFLICVIVPFVRCAGGLIWGRMRNVSPGRHKIQKAACGGVVLYCVMASLSGGWDFKNLFLFGMFLAIAVGAHRFDAPIEPATELNSMPANAEVALSEV